MTFGICGLASRRSGLASVDRPLRLDPLVVSAHALFFLICQNVSSLTLPAAQAGPSPPLHPSSTGWPFTCFLLGILSKQQEK